MKTLFHPNDILIKKNDPLIELAVIVEGSVQVRSSFSEFVLAPGNVIGLINLNSKLHGFTYQALTKVRISTLSFHGPDSLYDDFEVNPDHISLFQNSLIQQVSSILDGIQYLRYELDNLGSLVKNTYQDYGALCDSFSVPIRELPRKENLISNTDDTDVSPWIYQYYSALRTLSPENLDLLKQNIPLTVGLLVNFCRDIPLFCSVGGTLKKQQGLVNEIILNESSDDLFFLYSELFHQVSKKQEPDISLVSAMHQLVNYIEFTKDIDRALWEKRKKEHDSNKKDPETPIELSQHSAKTRIPKKELPAEASFEENLENLLWSDSTLIPDSAYSAEFTWEDISKPQVCDSSDHNVVPSETIDLLPDNSILADELSGSLDQILDFAGCEPNFKTAIRRAIQEYMKVDGNEESEQSKKISQALISGFFKVYSMAFFASIDASTVPNVLKMFFYFGYMDETLCGTENANALLLALKNTYCNTTHGHYTFYDWLMQIYQGKKEPSRNEFDIDYKTHLRQQVSRQEITKDEESRLLSDGKERVLFEMKNAFPLANKTTYGKLHGYMPVLSSYKITRPIDNLLIQESDIEQAKASILSIDFSAFYREILFSDTSIGIQKDYIQVEIPPDIILMPTIGSRGVMWQEIEGKYRDTPGRMMIPILSTELLEPMLTKLTAEFRWEMCKRLQGARWNDVTEPSLTSAYFDYLQFYKKNGDLSPEAKNKIQLSLARARNNFREAFVNDYMNFYQFESKGIPKFNKVLRHIFFTYCPLPKEIQQELSKNPLFQEGFKGTALQKQKLLTKYERLQDKLREQGKSLPENLASYIEFLKK